VERLCDRLAPLVDAAESGRWPALRRWWPAAAAFALVAAGLAGYRVMRTADDAPASAVTVEGGSTSRVTGAGATAPPSTIENAPEGIPTPEQTRRIEALLGEASAQRRRDQFVEALATLARARGLAPTSEPVRRMQEDVAMEWILNVRIESDESFGEAIKPALAVVDGSLPAAAGTRRADLLAHSGWAAFLMWRDGNRRLNPAEWYEEALSIDPDNPYANSMLAHWVLFQQDDVPRAVKLFETALRTGRGREAVRVLQWTGYGVSHAPDADLERVRLADAMRRGGERLNMSQAQALWGPYYFATSVSRQTQRQALLEALPPDDHISTLAWAFDEYAARDESRRRSIRYYVALLHARAGRMDQAIGDMQALRKELSQSPGSLQDAVQAALKRLQSGSEGQ
jgi:tetratricopeptide (TPR) repeat protein